MKLFEDMKFQDIVLIIFFIIIVYLLYKVNYSSENFITTSPPINDDISDLQTAYDYVVPIIQSLDIELNNILTSNSSYTINESTVKVNDLTVNGNVTFTNKDNLNYFMEIIPQNMIIAWAPPVNTSIPKGWALCDGSNETPDLRGRFIYGNDSTHPIKSTGGSENVILLTNMMPPHIHNIYGYPGCFERGPIDPSSCGNYPGNFESHNSWQLYNRSDCHCDSVSPDNIIDINGNTVKNIMSAYGTYTNAVNTTDPTKPQYNYDGYNSAHNNMPPYYILIYIIKIDPST